VDTREVGYEVTAMARPTEEFFDKLSRRGHEPLVDKITGTLRFDITDGGQTDHWLVEIDNGDIQVFHRNGQADCVIRGDRALQDDIASGRVNPMAAMLRGALWVDGDRELWILARRFLPGPPSSRDRQPLARGERPQS
jgi:putative sterol carrier protein